MHHWLHNDVQWASVGAGESEWQRQVGKAEKHYRPAGCRLPPGRPHFKFREVTRLM